MDILNQIILQMDRNDLKHFKIYAGRSTDNEDRKDLKLFEFIRKTAREYSDDAAFKKLYSGKGRNAFYRLKNRLMDDIARSIFMQYHTEDNTIWALYLTSLGYYFYRKNNYRIAYHFLQKAEKKALKVENYSLLDIIYSQMIYISRKIVSINPETYIKTRKENREKMNKLSEVEDILEAVEYRVNITQNLSHDQTAILELLQATIDDYTQDEDLKNSGKLQKGIYQVVSRILLQKKDYASLETYLINTYSEFEKKKLFAGDQKLKLEIISWIANTSFKNKKYHQSLEYAEKLKTEMGKNDKQKYDNFEYFYYNALVINFSVINPDKAIEILLGLTKKETIERNPYYSVFIYLNLALLYNQKKNYDQAMKFMNKLYMDEGYKGTDGNIKLQVNIGELIIRYDLKEFDFLEYRFKQVMKDNKEAIAKPEMIKEKDFLKIFASLSTDNFKTKSLEFKNAVKEYYANYMTEFEEEEPLFRYNEWLAEKANLNYK